MVLYNMCFKLQSRIRTMPEWYKYIVLAAACLAQFASWGYIVGTMSTLYLAYEEQYAERRLSSIIGSSHLSVSLLMAFPGNLLCRAFGERITQTVGGLLMCSGIFLTAYTTQAWQGYLATGILSGIGAGLIVSATYIVTGKYFPRGNTQLASLTALQISMNLAAIVIPKFTDSLRPLGFKNMWLVLASLVSINSFLGIFFVPKSEETNEVDESTKPTQSRFILQPKGRKSGVYELASISGTLLAAHGRRVTEFKDGEPIEADVDQKIREEQSKTPAVLFTGIIRTQDRSAHSPSPSSKGLSQTSEQAELYKMGTGRKMDLRRQSSLSSFVSKLGGDSSAADGESSAGDDRKICKRPEKADNLTGLYATLSSDIGTSIADLLHDTSLAKQTIKQMLKRPVVICYLIQAFFATFGTASFWSIGSDFSKHHLHLSDDVISSGYTVAGITMMTASILYLIAARYVTFCATFLMFVIMTMEAVTFGAFAFIQNSGQFYVVIGLAGALRTLWLINMVACDIEIAGPKFGLMLYMIENFPQGLGGMTGPQFTAYFQTEVSIYGGLIITAVIKFGAALLLLPFAIRRLASPKNYTSKTGDEIVEISVTPLSASLG